jgi:hypothetical protein
LHITWQQIHKFIIIPFLRASYSLATTRLQTYKAQLEISKLIQDIYKTRANKRNSQNNQRNFLEEVLNDEYSNVPSLVQSNTNTVVDAHLVKRNEYSPSLIRRSVTPTIVSKLKTRQYAPPLLDRLVHDLEDLIDAVKKQISNEIPTFTKILNADNQLSEVPFRCLQLAYARLHISPLSLLQWLLFRCIKCNFHRHVFMYWDNIDMVTTLAQQIFNQFQQQMHAKFLLPFINNN